MILIELLIFVGLKIAWNTTFSAMSSDGESTVETVFKVARIPYGVTNCIRHMMRRVFIEAILKVGTDLQKKISNWTCLSTSIDNTLIC